MSASADERRAGWAPALGGAQDLTLLDAVAAGGYALLLCPDDDAPRMVERLLAAAGGATNAARLSEQAAGRGDVAPWVCLAFGLAPFDPEPAPRRLAAFFREEAESGRRPLLIVEAAGRLTKPELAALRRLTEDGARCAVILIGPGEAADRLRAASPAPLAAVAEGLAADEERAQPEPAPRALDPFAVIARVAPAEPKAAMAAPVSPEPERAAPDISPAPTPRRRLPYGAGAAAAAAFLAVFVLGSLYLIESRPEPAQVAAVSPEQEAPAPPLAAPAEAATVPEAPAPAAKAASEGEAANPEPPPAPAPAPEAAEPPEPRVTIHHVAASRARAGELLLALRRAGFADVALWPVAEPPAATGVRYFDDADAEVAALLAAALKEALPEGPSFTPELAPETTAPRGVLEIWLAG